MMSQRKTGRWKWVFSGFKTSGSDGEEDAYKLCSLYRPATVCSVASFHAPHSGQSSLQGSSLSLLKRKSCEVIWHEESFSHREGKGQHAGEEVLK